MNETKPRKDARATATAEADRATSKPDPFRDPVGYLKASGWVPDGDSRSRLCRWYDPTKPRVSTVSQFPLGKKRNRDGKIVLGPRNEPIELFQQVHTAAASPISRDDAIELQISRDEMAVLQDGAVAA